MKQTESRCPRCGAGFLCGVNDTAPCACTIVPLDAKTLADLRARYEDCLCVGCLRELAAVTDRGADLQCSST